METTISDFRTRLYIPAIQKLAFHFPHVKIYCNKNKFPQLPFYGPNSKPQGSRGLSKHYHLRFDPKLGNGVCAIRRIPYASVACTSMLD